MPNFPGFTRYDSKASLTTDQPTALATKSTQGDVMKTVADTEAKAAESGFKFIDALATIQKTTAQANYRTGEADILKQAENDPDPNSQQKYQDQITKLKADTLSKISFGGAQKEMGLQLGYESKVASVKIAGDYKKKAIDVGQAAILQNIDTEVNNPTPSSLFNVKTVLDKNVQAGIISHEAAYKLYDKANRDIGQNRVSKDLFQAQTPEQVDMVRQGLASGYYEQGGVTIDPEKKKALFDIADRAYTSTEKKIQAQAVESMAKNRMETIVGIASNDPKFQNVDTTAISQYDPELANVLTKTKDFMVNYNPQIPVNQQPLKSAGLTSSDQMIRMKDYARSITDIFMKSSNEDLGKFVLRELEKKGDGMTPSIKIAAFSNLAFLKSKANNLQNGQDAEAKDRYEGIKAGVKYIQASNSYLSPEAIGDFVVKNFLSGNSGRDQIMQEAKNTLKDSILNRYKEVAKLPSTPNKIVDGEASVEDLQSGTNELKGEKYSGDRTDDNSRE